MIYNDIQSFQVSFLDVEYCMEKMGLGTLK